MARRPRSTRSRVIETVLTLAAVAGVWLWLTNGGPEAFGEWFASYYGQ
jgi:hypothetical protein